MSLEAAQKLKEKLAQEQAETEFDITRLSEVDLLLLHQRVVELMPKNTMQNTNFVEELMAQYTLVKALLNDVLSDKKKGVPENQKAQIVNSCNATLKAVIEMQAQVYTTERLKRIESIIVEVFESEPEEVRKKFLEKYEKELEKL